jgi:DNA-nicking Smr family endonuclease|tara:strand:+ start:4749 stop:5171 length:423 start_codon:yes stop_codon:yes gene_type:complete
LSKKLSDKDKKDWEKFVSDKEKVLDKDFFLKKNIQKDITEKIDLHGLSLENANQIIDEFINKCFQKNISKIIVITGKGLRSKNISNPYVSKNLSILKHSVPEYIESNIDLMKMIKEIKNAEINDGGGGAFYIYLKKKIKE